LNIFKLSKADFCVQIGWKGGEVTRDAQTEVKGGVEELDRNLPHAGLAALTE